jgi:hypothetical protein
MVIFLVVAAILVFRRRAVPAPADLRLPHVEA